MLALPIVDIFAVLCNLTVLNRFKSKANFECCYFSDAYVFSWVGSSVKLSENGTVELSQIVHLWTVRRFFG
jgi:hypothetical protein